MARPRTPLLNRDKIAAAALAMVDRDGTFTMPRLAEHLGVQVSSIYHHVPGGREGIVELIRVHATSAIDGSAFDELAWDDAFRLWARSFLDAFRAHPSAIRLLATEPVRDQNLVAVYNSVAGGLQRAGVPAGEVYGLIVATESFLLGCALDLVAPETVARPEAGSHPELSAALDAAPPGRRRAEQSYELGLDMLIAGIRARLSTREM